MNCYYHQSQQAIGICKNCQKGICADCATDVGNGLACKNSCEAQVLEINQFFKQGKTQFSRMESSLNLSTKWVGTVGGILIILAIAGFFVYAELFLPNLMLLVLGLSFLTYAYKSSKNENAKRS